MVAEALDAEELEDYNSAVLMAIAFNSPKQIKNWKWNSIDKAGTAIRDYTPKNRVEQVTETMKDFGKQVFRMSLDNAKRNPTRAMEFARITGREIVFMNPDGFLFNNQAEKITEYDKSNTLIVQLDYDGNFIE